MRRNSLFLLQVAFCWVFYHGNRNKTRMVVFLPIAFLFPLFPLSATTGLSAAKQLKTLSSLPPPCPLGTRGKTLVTWRHLCSSMYLLALPMLLVELSLETSSQPFPPRQVPFCHSTVCVFPSANMLSMGARLSQSRIPPSGWRTPVSGSQLDHMELFPVKVRNLCKSGREHSPPRLLGGLQMMSQQFLSLHPSF